MLPSLLVDAVNGWIIRNMAFSISISQIYRIALLGLMLLWLAKYRYHHFLVLLGLITALLAESLYHAQYFREFSWMIADLHFHLRMILHFVYFLFFWGLIRNMRDRDMAQQKFIHWAMMLFVFSFLIIAANIVMGSMGVGYSTVSKFSVGDEVGYGGLGFFKAGNDVSATYVAITGLIFYRIWNGNRRLGYYLLFGFICIALAVMMQTKVIILGTFLLFVGVPIVHSFPYLPQKRVFIKLLLLVVLGVGTASLVASWLLVTNAGLIAKFTYLYEKSGLVYALMSGRNYFLDLATVTFQNKYDLLDILFGRGWSYYLQEMGVLYGKERVVEIDYVDIFMINGMTGLVVELACWLFYLSIAFNGIRLSSLCRVVMLIDLLMLGIAASAGHVLYSSFNCMFIGLINALPILERSIEKRKLAGGLS